MPKEKPVKPIQCWNLRGCTRPWIGRNTPNPHHIEHYYVGAHSKAHAVRLLIQAGYSGTLTVHYLTEFGSPHWGTGMKGIIPGVGVWVLRRYGSPVERVL